MGFPIEGNGDSQYQSLCGGKAGGEEFFLFVEARGVGSGISGVGISEDSC